MFRSVAIYDLAGGVTWRVLPPTSSHLASPCPSLRLASRGCSSQIGVHCRCVSLMDRRRLPSRRSLPSHWATWAPSKAGMFFIPRSCFRQRSSQRMPLTAVGHGHGRGLLQSPMEGEYEGRVERPSNVRGPTVTVRRPCAVPQRAAQASPVGPHDAAGAGVNERT
ncbi:hypothetical protein C8Q78DRAFT_1041793 [Trametes maxima]|nr:hypothetical protein C8Q78DRAFT_1041793 [Trametes maxima]